MDPDEYDTSHSAPPSMTGFEYLLDPQLEEADLGPVRPVTYGLAGIVAENIRYEAARYELTQQDLADAVSKSRAAISLRYTGRVAWTLNEVGTVAQLMGIRPAELVTRARRPGVGL